MTELSISTDSTNGIGPEYRSGAAFKSPPVPVLQDGVWRSSLAFEDVYV